MDEDLEIIELDRAGDLFLELTFEDENGPIDISAAELRFVVRNKFAIIPGAHPSDPTGRSIHFTEAHAALLGSKDREWLLRLSEGTDDTPIKRGIIRAIGFAPTDEQVLNG